METVSIIGLGWLGLPLAKHLSSKGYEVKGSTTSAEKANRLRESGIKAAELRFVPHPEGLGFGGLLDADVMFVNIPPRSRTASADFYLEQNKFLIEMAAQAGIKKIVFASSTSVFPDVEAICREESILGVGTSGSPGILEAERLWMEDGRFHSTIIRYGGLLGLDRIPGKYFSGKNEVVGHTRVNFIHQDDAVRIGAWIIENGLWGEVFNAVAPIHPIRRDIYEQNAKELGFPPPASYAPISPKQGKIISSDKIMATGFQFDLPDPMGFWYNWVSTNGL